MLRLAACLALAFSLAIPALAEEVVPQSKTQVELTFAPLVKKAAPAVVNVFTRTVIKERPMSPFFDDPFFQQFFGNQNPRERVQNSLGSGVIVRPDGLIVTNNHVIAKADEIRVVLSDGREFPAQVIAGDEKFDIGILKIETKGEVLPTLDLKDSDDINVGDLVLAIGNPFGVGQTVTMGIVSALARTNIGVGDYGYYIQTDAAINPGNSGGALIGTDGKLVGINTAIYSKTGGSIGIGFAIPSNMVARIIDAEASGGKLVQPWIGVSGEALTADIAVSMGLPHPGGVVVQQVYPMGPGDHAGLQPGDVIIGVNDRNIGDPGGLRFRLATQKVGGTASLRRPPRQAAGPAGEADRSPRGAAARRDRAQGRAALERGRRGQSLAGGQRRARRRGVEGCCHPENPPRLLPGQDRLGTRRSLDQDQRRGRRFGR